MPVKPTRKPLECRLCNVAWVCFVYFCVVLRQSHFHIKSECLCEYVFIHIQTHTHTQNVQNINAHTHTNTKMYVYIYTQTCTHKQDCFSDSNYLLTEHVHTGEKREHSHTRTDIQTQSSVHVHVAKHRDIAADLRVHRGVGGGGAICDALCLRSHLPRVECVCTTTQRGITTVFRPSTQRIHANKSEINIIISTNVYICKYMPEIICTTTRMRIIIIGDEQH